MDGEGGNGEEVMCVFNVKTLFVSRFSNHPPRSLNPQDRSNSAPNVCLNNVRVPFGADAQRLLAGASLSATAATAALAANAGGKTLFQVSNRPRWITQQLVPI